MDVRQTFQSENCRIWLSYLQVCEKACRLQSNTIVIILEQIDFQEYPQISKFDIIFRRWGFNSPVVINFILWNSRSTYVWTKKSRMSCLSWGSQSQPSATESPQFESPDSLDITPTTPNRTSTHPISSRPPNLSFFSRIFHTTVSPSWCSGAAMSLVFFSLWQLQITPKTLSIWGGVFQPKCRNK